MLPAMKVFAAILVFMLTAQPAPAEACDIHDSGDMTAHATMQHDGMHHDKGESASDHDCCDTGTTSDDGCADSAQCGACAHSVAVVILSLAPLQVAAPAAVPAVYDGNRLTPSHATHPYRPPKYIS